MNLILHQFKTDARHFRWWLLALWISFVGQAALMCGNSFAMQQQLTVQVLLLVWQIVAGVVLVATLVQADAFAGTTAAWLTRPVRRQHLFWAKSAFIVLLLLLPRVAMQGAAWIMRGYSPHLWICAAGESLLFSGVVVLVTAALASFSRSLPRFFLTVAIAVAVMFAWDVALETFKLAGLIHGPEVARSQSYDASVLTIAYLVIIAGALAAWIAQAALRRVRMSMACFTIGYLAFPCVTMMWRVDFLKPHLKQSIPVKVSLMHGQSATNMPTGQMITGELIVSGAPEQDVAVTQDISASITFDDDGKQRENIVRGDLRADAKGRHRPTDLWQSRNYYGIIEKTFPPDTLWFNDDFHWNGARAFTGTNNEFSERLAPGFLRGNVDLDLFAVKKVAEIPLRPATVNALPGQWITVRSVKLIDNTLIVSLSESYAAPLWDRDMQTAGYRIDDFDRLPVCTYVLFHAASGEALITGPSDAQNPFPDELTGHSEIFFQLRYPYSPLRERLTGTTAAQWMHEVRLYVFAPVYDGSAQQSFEAEHYQWPPRK